MFWASPHSNSWCVSIIIAVSTASPSWVTGQRDEQDFICLKLWINFEGSFFFCHNLLSFMSFASYFYVNWHFVPASHQVRTNKSLSWNLKLHSAYATRILFVFGLNMCIQTFNCWRLMMVELSYWLMGFFVFSIDPRI